MPKSNLKSKAKSEAPMAAVLDDTNRVRPTIDFIFDKQNRMILAIELEWQDQPVGMALSSLMTFLFENEGNLHRDDADFCYTLAKLIKKVQIGNDFYLAIPDDRDMALFFKKALALNIQLWWRYQGELVPVQTDFPLPLTFSVSSQFNGVLTCVMQYHDSWSKAHLGWLTFKHQNETLCFCNGTLIGNLSRDLEDFISLFFDRSKVQYKGQDAFKFIHQIYNPNKKRLYWQVQADFAAILPQETTPIPILTVTSDEDVLKPDLTYQYGDTIIEPTFKGNFVKDKKNGKYYKRMLELENIYQDDLITLFGEHDLSLMLHSPGDIALFLDALVPILTERGWIIHNKATGIVIDKIPVELDFAIESSQLNWFSFEPTTTIAGQRMALQEIARLMVENKGYLKTKQGFIRISSESQRELQTLSQLGAFKVGKKFTKAEMVPFITAANLKSDQTDTHHFINQLKNLHSVGHCSPSKNFKGQLRDYQQYGLNWLHFLQQTGLGGVLADDMGLGKTIQAIAFCSQLEGKGPVLVVGPTNVLYNWENEIKKFLPKAKTVIYGGTNRAALVSKLDTYDFVITTFGIVKNDEEWLSQLTFKAIFVDEAQYIKNPMAQISKAIKTLKSNFKLAMTGTPIENHLQDLWNLFDFVMPGYLGTKREFDVFIKDGHKEMIRGKIRPFVLRREKREVLQSLPEKTEIILKCPMSSAQRQLYETVLAAVKQGIRNSVGKTERLHVLTSLLKLRQVCTHPGLLAELKDKSLESSKFDLAKEKIEELVDEGHKIVLFSQFTEMLDIVQEWSTAEKIYTERIDGSITGKGRMQAVERFQTQVGSGLFLISLKAGGVGINLTAADYVIHLDPWWNPAIESQATDRVHRMGQKNKVIVYKMITEGTIEEKIQVLQDSKRTLLAEMIDIDSVNDKAINFDELKSLLA
jgi:superfamily II DNA or RNA helicase